MKTNLILNKFVAFTMAEVLLVVAIIGITAALALPNLSQGIDEDKYVMMAKATYSELDSGFSRMLANKSLSEIYTDANATTSAQRSKAIVDELSKYIKMGKNCGNTLTQCYNSSKTYKSTNGSVLENSWLSGKTNGAAFTLPSGAVVIVYEYKGAADGYNVNVDFDVDGEKGPCKYNVDIFRAAINNEYSNYDSLTSDMYFWCTGLKKQGKFTYDNVYDGLDWVLSIGNMDYLHCNDLNWSTKTQCD